MGYYTSFSIEIKNWSENRKTVTQDFYEEVADKLTEISGYSWDGSLEQGDIKWYSHDNDMKKISLEFPDVLFQVDGNGEEDGDIWRQYFLNGKTQECKTTITFTEFDADKLK